MTTMLEKIARALAVEWYCETGHDDAVAVAAAETQWEAFESLARAALQAIREPDAGMVDAAQCVGGRVSTFNRQAEPMTVKINPDSTRKAIRRSILKQEGARRVDVMLSTAALDDLETARALAEITTVEAITNALELYANRLLENAAYNV